MSDSLHLEFLIELYNSAGGCDRFMKIFRLTITITLARHRHTDGWAGCKT